MANQRVHIAMWKDAAGFTTAATLQSNQVHATVTYAEKPSVAVAQIRDYLRWLAERQDWYAETEMEDVEVYRVRVAIRPQHVHEGRRLLMPTTVEVNVPCVVGKLRESTWLCTLPTMSISFVVHTKTGVLQVAEDQVRACLSASSVKEIAPYLFSGELELRDISIPLPPVKVSVHRKISFPNLEAVANPLGKAVRGQKSDLVFERGDDILRLTQQLFGYSSSILLIGDEGVGKSSILGQAARGLVKLKRETQRNAPHPIWATNGGRLIAGMKYLGEWQERCEAVVDELSAINGWLCLDGMSELVATGSSDPRASVASFLLTYLRHGQLRAVCEATASEVMAVERLLPEFFDGFAKFPIDRLDAATCDVAVQKAADVITQQSRVGFADGVASDATRLARRFEPYRPPLGTATSLLRRLADNAKRRNAADQRTERSAELNAESPAKSNDTELAAQTSSETSSQSPATKSVSIDDALEAYAERTGLRLDILLDDVQLPYDDVVAALQHEVVGQDAACKNVANVVTKFKAGLQAPNRPLGVLLFCGPTGVGKTQLAKTLGTYLFGHARDDTMVRLDMSEYGGASAADRLLSKPDGSPSNWIQRVRKQPFCVLLLDEIEKANPQVFDVLMGLMDEGRLTDAFGRVTNFHSAIVIMTSNLGSSLSAKIGFDGSEAERFEASVHDFFRPEFSNRLDAIVPFGSLSPVSCREIVGLELKSLRERAGLSRKGITVEFSEGVIDLLMSTGFDPALGARPLQRSLEQHVTATLARYLAERNELREVKLRVEHEEGIGVRVRIL